MRQLDRLVALVLGVVIAAVAILTGIEVVALAAGQPPLVIPRHTWDQQLHNLGWGADGVAVTGVALAGLGVLLVVLQIVVRMPVRLSIRSRPGERAFVSRKGLARRLTHEVDQLEVVGSTRIKMGRRHVTARVVLAARTDRSEGAAAARQALEGTLQAVAVVPEPRIRVRAKEKVPPQRGEPASSPDADAGERAGA